MGRSDITCRYVDDLAVPRPPAWEVPGEAVTMFEIMYRICLSVGFPEVNLPGTPIHRQILLPLIAARKTKASLCTPGEYYPYDGFGQLGDPDWLHPDMGNVLDDSPFPSWLARPYDSDEEDYIPPAPPGDAELSGVRVINPVLRLRGPGAWFHGEGAPTDVFPLLSRVSKVRRDISDVRSEWPISDVVDYFDGSDALLIPIVRSILLVLLISLIPTHSADFAAHEISRRSCDAADCRAGSSGYRRFVAQYDQNRWRPGRTVSIS
ncbi:hypothetical protein FB451DRAFT_1180041 [Mycena latifolia]|nr:hypothetical protein FB451DRAFT_1180041 [Mycena latifolia]